MGDSVREEGQVDVCRNKIHRDGGKGSVIRSTESKLSLILITPVKKILNSN